MCLKKKDVKIGERRKGSDYDLIRISVKCKTCFMHAKYIDTVTFLAFDFFFYYKILDFDFSVYIYIYIYIYNKYDNITNL